jgi:hypothetical protein
VDVGYLYAAAGELLLGTANRSECRVDAEGMIHALMKLAAAQLGDDLLRVYWFDAARDRVPTIDQRVIAQLAQVKLRLGNLNLRGQQKGVDAQIRGDLENLARHRAVTDAVLLAGDEDMISAEAAQSYGVRVHLWGVRPPGTNQAERLVGERHRAHARRGFVRPYFGCRGAAAHATPTEVSSGRPAIALPASAITIRRCRSTRHRRRNGTPARRRRTARNHIEIGEYVAQKWILTRAGQHRRPVAGRCRDRDRQGSSSRPRRSSAFRCGRTKGPGARRVLVPCIP